MIMNIHRAGDGYDLDVFCHIFGRPQLITFHRRTMLELDRIVRVITRSKR